VNPGRYIDDPQLLQGCRTATISAFERTLSPSDVVWIADGVSKEFSSRQLLVYGNTDNVSYCPVTMIHGGRANILTIGGNVTSAAGDAVRELYYPLTRGTGLYYSVRISHYRTMGGSVDGEQTTIVGQSF